MNWLFSWVVACLVIWPISFQLTEFAGRPVDLVASDLLFALLLVVPRRRSLTIPKGVSLGRLWAVRLVAAATLTYCIALAATSYAESSEMSRVVSAVKFIKPLAFVLLGSYFAAVTSPIVLLNRIAIAFACMSCATFGTAVCMPGFPHAPWGANLLAYPVYGFPNSAMTMYGICVPLLLAAADTRQTAFSKWALRGIASLTAMIVATSLSRSSTIAMCAGVFFYLYLTGRIYLPVFIMVLGIVMAMTFSSLLNVVTQNQEVSIWLDRFSARISRTMETSDPFSGRGDIWEQTIDLWAERPVFGYAFESFGNYSTYDTPHQQYLEILFKSGALGATLYGLLLLLSLLGLLHLAKHSTAATPPWYLLRAVIAMLAATMVGNLSQPNLTYSVTGNALFFLLGLSLNKHAAAGLVVRPQTRDKTSSRASITNGRFERDPDRTTPQRRDRSAPAATPHHVALVARLQSEGHS